MKEKQKYSVGMANLSSGESRIVEVKGRSVGIFFVDGQYYALHNRCPHMAGPLCEGPVTGTTLETDKFEFNYGYQNELVRCGWHGWEFEIKSGKCLVDQRMRARTYPVSEQDGELFVHM